jgi:hypothetical protein
MRLIVSLQVLGPDEGGYRRNPVFDGYRPTWVSDRKPEHNGASVVLPSADDRVDLGSTRSAVLLPHRPDLWIDQIEPGDVLYGMEGRSRVAKATVRRIEVTADGAQAWWTGATRPTE